ncbi:MAG TPA: 30S ribosome-binding factor RbfA [bacterium]|nr:30S ribosome-binding factor RbfA [bacterium]
MQHRDKRVADAIKDTVAKIVLTELSDPKIGFVTVTRCHISRDLKNATVYFSIMGDEAARQRSFEHLQGARGYVRRRLGQMVKFRVLPELRFALDDMLAHEMHINEIISELHRDEPGEQD